MPSTRYIFGLLRTGEVVEEIAMQGVSMSNKLNTWGSAQGSFGFDQSGKLNSDLKAATVPGQCYLAIELDDIPIWFGIVWTRSYQSQAKVAQVSARTLEAYAAKSRVDADMSWVDYEQMNIFRELWISMQAKAAANIDVTVPAAFGDANTRQLTLLASDRKKYETVFSDLADGEDGFDWTIDITKSASGVYLRSLRMGYPFLDDNTTTPHQFEYPGNVTNYYSTDSLTPAATHLTVLGRGEGSAMLTATHTHQDMIDGGKWNRFEEDVPRKSVSEQGLLNSLAGQLGKLRRPPMTTIKAFVKGDVSPVFGTYSLGDSAQLLFEDALHPNGAAFNSRIVAWKYYPTSDDNVAEAELIFEGDELNEG